jgi:hypothetical protein
VAAEDLSEGAAEPKEVAAKIRSHAATNAEILSLCKDLQVRARSTGLLPHGRTQASLLPVRQLLSMGGLGIPDCMDGHTQRG